MISFPNAKINLGIKVLGKRTDGYHNILSVFYPIPLTDILEITESSEEDVNQAVQGLQEIRLLHQSVLEGGATVSFAVSGNEIEGDPESNLCLKAFRKFNDRQRLKGHYYMHLHKIIPSGAGLGGGSSDATFVLLNLNRLSGKPFNEAELSAMALELGSDCPFFIRNRPCLAAGRGEELQEIPLNLGGYHLVLVKPPVHMSTAEAFRGIVPDAGYLAYPDLSSIPTDQWQRLLVNDFEKVVFEKYPEVATVRQELMQAGAVYAGMTGSGSAVYGLFRDQTYRIKRVPGYFYFEDQLP